MSRGGYKLPRESRIRKSREFHACRVHGLRLRSLNFRINTRYLENEPARIGLAVSRKVGNAVVRNRVKRLLREFFRNNAPAGWQMVIMADPGSAILSLAEITLELSPLLARLKSCPPPCSD